MEVSAAIIDIEVPEYRLYEQFQEAAIANSGRVFFCSKNNESWDKENT